MKRPPVRIRTFILATVLVLLLLPAIAGGAAWLVERGRQQTDVRHRVSTAVTYLTSHRTEIRDPKTVRGFARLAGRLDLLAELTLITKPPPAKSQLYVSPALNPAVLKQRLARQGKAAQELGPSVTPPTTSGSSTTQVHRLVPVGTRKAPALLAVDLYYRPTSRTTRALVAVVSGVLVLLVGLAAAVWLAGRWMVAPLASLSAQVDKVAGGDLAIAVPRSRIGEIANIAQAVEGMTAALGETSQRRAEADEARRFLVTSIAHDLRTPLFALRGHLQAIGSRLGDPDLHLRRAEARADALERLIGNLFAYTRDDYAQPALQVEPVPVAHLIEESTAGLEHAARLRANTFEVAGDSALVVLVDRDRTKRALTNVLDNALRHSPAGAPVHVEWTAVDDSSVEVTIEDEGPGIDSDLLPHIFEPGVRGSPDGASDGGAGLGLTIAKRLLEHQGATLTARNKDGAGAAVMLALPRAPVSAASPGPSSHDVRAAARTART
jgi:signal transduction histidine kinase